MWNEREMQSIKLLSKLKAATLWTVCSSLIFCLVLIPLYMYWYPEPLNLFFQAKDILILAISIQSLFGFVFISLIYNPQRKDHHFNLISIASLHVVFLVIVIYVLGVTRPMWLVQHEDRFFVIQPVHTQSDFSSALTQLMQNFWQVSHMQTIHFSNSPIVKQKQIEAGMVGKGLEFKPEQYQTFDSNFAQHYLKDIQLLDIYNDRNRIKEKLAKYDLKKIAWMPLSSGFADAAQDGVVILNRKGQVLEIVDLRPWE